jgi:hypothetical protein
MDKYCGSTVTVTVLGFTLRQRHLLPTDQALERFARASRQHGVHLRNLRSGTVAGIGDAEGHFQPFSAVAARFE